MKSLLALAFVIVSGLAVYLGYTAFSGSTKLSKDPLDLIQVTGVVRRAGLGVDEKNKLNLGDVSYQITNITGSGFIFDGLSFTGLFLKPNPSRITEYEGKCVRAFGKLDSTVWSFITKNSVVDGQYTYQRVVFKPTIIFSEDMSKCSPYAQKLVEPDSTKLLILSGTFERFTRPAPDIGYDYSFRSDTKVFDPLGGINASNTLIANPGSNNIWVQIEKSFGRKVQVQGFYDWGYSESRYFTVTRLDLL